MEFTLKEWSLDYADDIVEAINNKKVLDNLRDGIPYPYTRKDAESFIGHMLSCDKEKEFYFGICVGGKIVGNIGITRQQNIHNRTAELGYFLAEGQWGKGIMTGAVREACGRVFERTDILRIFAEPFDSNTGSCRVLEKAGFVLEGILRKNAVKNGEVRDMRMYALVR